MPIKITIYKILIRPVLTYGGEACNMNVEMIKQLAVFERKLLCKILGAVKINDIWRRRYNAELMALYEDLDLGLPYVAGTSSGHSEMGV